MSGPPVLPAVLAVLALILLTGCTRSGASSTSEAAEALARYASVTRTPPLAVAEAQQNCGYVNTPTSRTDGTLLIHAGRIDCTGARAVVVHYLALPYSRLSGPSAAADIDGWRCVTPTATAGRAAGYVAQCVRGSDDVRVVAPLR